MARQTPDQAADLDDLRGVQPDGRLVEDEQLWLVQDGLRQPDALPIALGELADRPRQIAVQAASPMAASCSAAGIWRRSAIIFR